MRHLAVACAAALALSSAVRAADVAYGGAFALNFSKMTGDTADAGVDESKFGIAVGATVDFALSDAFTLQTGLIYTQKGGEGEKTTGSETATNTVVLNYLEIPILAKASLADGKAYALGGLGIGINTKSELESEIGGASETIDTEDNTETLNLALVVGAGASLQAGSGKLTAGIQYSLGLTNISNQSGVESKNNTLSIVFGYSF